MHRLLLILVIAAALAPGTWLRTPFDRRAGKAEPAIYRALAIPAGQAGEVRLIAAWEVLSKDTNVSGFSALRWRKDDHLFLLSDSASYVRLPVPGTHGAPKRARVLPAIQANGQHVTDTESLAHDPVSGRSWIGMESANAIVRYSADMQKERVVRPVAMRRWGSNSGPESMVRLADGRFIVLAEGDPWSEGPTQALLFPDDPISGAQPVPFTFDRPDGYRPVDMAQLADGRVLVLLRRLHFTLPPTFSGLIMVLDPAGVGAGKLWRGRIIARLETPWPTDNYEGIAVGRRTAAGQDLWIVSDDNRSAFQRTILLRLRWAED